MGTLNGKYSVGEPIEYASIYGYGKRRFPVLNQAGEAIGCVKEELLLNGEGQEVGKLYYSRNIMRPHGAKRFYDSVESLVLAYGGSMDRTKKKPVAKVRTPKAAPAKKRVTKKAASRTK